MVTPSGIEFRCVSHDQICLKMADPEIGNQTLVKNNKITRGENAEVDFEIDAAEDHFVYDELGNKIRFGDIYKRKKSILIFVRVR
jgi:hypothetical protein